MRVYAIKAKAKYGGGMAIVAAPDEAQAIELASGIEDTWHTNYAEPYSVLPLPVEYGGIAQILAHHEAGE